MTPPATAPRSVWFMLLQPQVVSRMVPIQNVARLMANLPANVGKEICRNPLSASSHRAQAYSHGENPASARSPLSDRGE
jgi:hypothetical protein